jgi:NADPH:quinone reductase-like Zn-dependent oxidoreductase
MRAAGVDRIGGAVRLLELPEPGPPRAGEVLIDVRACGVGNWDEIARTGGWDLGTTPPMALGVQAAGTVAAVGADVSGFGVGDAVTTHSLPGGSWAERFTAASDHVALLPAGVPLSAAGALPVPALTADQALDAVDAGPGQTVLVNGASGVTGGLLVQLAVQRGARVIATAGHPERPRALGAEQVLDYHERDWPERVRVDAAVNAVRSGSAEAVRAVRDGGRLATITSDLPAACRGITMTDILVAADGTRLRRLVALFARGAITMTVGAGYPLEEAAAAMARVRQGTDGEAVVLVP